jgi:hypothetical protein
MAVSERAGWLKSRPDSTVPRRCPNAPPRPFRPAVFPDSATIRADTASPRCVDCRCPKPPSPGSSRRRPVRSRRRRRLHRPCAGECGRVVASLAPPSALIFSLIPVGHRRRPRSTCHSTPPSTLSCRAAVHAPVSPATLSPAVSHAPVRSPP